MTTSETLKLVDREAILKSRRREYETIVVLSPSLEEAKAKELIKKVENIVTSNDDGIMLRTDDWGKLRLPYAMDKHQQGRFVYYRMIGTAACMKELDRSLKLDVSFLRFQTIKLSDILSDAEIEERKQKVPAEKVLGPHMADEEETDFRFR